MGPNQAHEVDQRNDAKQDPITADPMPKRNGGALRTHIARSGVRRTKR
jgi:hypothetical protein